MGDETGGAGENYRPVASHWQTLSHNVVHLSSILVRTVTFEMMVLPEVVACTCATGSDVTGSSPDRKSRSDRVHMRGFPTRFFLFFLLY